MQNFFCDAFSYYFYMIWSKHYNVSFFIFRLLSITSVTMGLKQLCSLVYVLLNLSNKSYVLGYQ